MEWKFFHPRANMDMLGYIPGFLREDDPDPAAKQIVKRYIGGWEPISGFMVRSGYISYPGDEPRILLAETKLRDEVIRFYRGAWLGIFQPDGTCEIARVD